MFTLLNVVVFFLLTGYAFKLMFSNPSYVKLSKTEKVLLSGREKFLLLTMVSGMVMVGVDLGINLSALRLMVWIGMILLAFVLYTKSPKLSGVFIPYILFLLWLALSLAWTVDIGYGIRAYLKYIYPFLIMLFAATFVRSRDFIYVAMRWMIFTSFIYSLFLGGFMTHVLGIWSFYANGLFWPMSTLADYLGIMSGLSFLMWWRTGEKKYFLLIGWFFLSAVFQSVRTGLLAILIVSMVAFYIRYRLKALPFIAGIFLIALVSVLFIPQVRDKMFYDPSAVNTINDLETVNTTQIDSNGRFAMWEWTLNRLYEPNPLVGSGIGMTQYTFYEINHPFYPIRVIHNDYVQMLADNGEIALFLYAFFVLIAIFVAFRNTTNKTPEYLLNTSFLVITSFTATSVAMMTDNVVLYVLAVFSYPFIFLGIMIAYHNIHKAELSAQNTEGTQ
ncbi:MAG: O-antigen ligase family protein [Sulfuricurvum sp.]|jgi:O-antigen ligase